MEGVLEVALAFGVALGWGCDDERNWEELGVGGDVA